MYRALLITTVLILTSISARAAAPAAATDTAPKSTWTQVSPYENPSYDTGAEAQLLDMANAERSRAGLAPLKMDDGLVLAARQHAAEMASKGQLSHQFPGEAALPDRLSATSNLHFNSAGENVAVATTTEDAHRALMASPPHRDNLLSPNFNVTGMGVYRSGNRIYVAQDFGSSTATYSVQQAQELVSSSVEQLRTESRMPRLQRVNDNGTQSSACAMAQADSLSGAAPAPGAYMLRYTSMTPETLPNGISKVIAQRGLHAYSAGTCYARSQKYPNGAYWVVLLFY